MFNKKINKKVVVETNFYHDTGSKLKATAGEFINLYKTLKKNDIFLIWVTDGFGWKKDYRPLNETFEKIEYLLNLTMIKENTFEQILLDISGHGNG